MRERMRGKRRADAPLPGERRAPEQEAGAALGRAEPRGWAAAGYPERSFATPTSERIVSGKSAMSSGPASFASSSGPSICAV
jgi:hypothetical protein